MKTVVHATWLLPAVASLGMSSMSRVHAASVPEPPVAYLDGKRVDGCSRTGALAVFIGNVPGDGSQFAKWLGRDVDAIQLHGGHANWDDWQSSLQWLSELFRDTVADIRWSVPLIASGATLKDAGDGNYNARYRLLAEQFVKNQGRQAPINIRVGWEFNGNGWNPWSAVGRDADYVRAYRNFVTTFRSVSKNFRFEWTPAIGEVGMNPELAYPGDEYVDLIGMDFYYNTAWDPKDAVAAWDFFVTRKYGLLWHQDFAAAHGKSTAYAEWAVNSDSAGPFIQRAAQWFRQYRIVYQSYWNSNADYRGKLSDGQYPQAAAAYRSAFASAPSANNCSD